MFLFFINNYGKIYIVVTLNIILLKGEIMSNKIKLTEGIFIESYKDNWGNRGIIIEKYGKEKRIHPKLKETNISLKGFDKKVSLEENQKSGKVLTIPENEWLEILEKIGYIIPVADDEIKRIVEIFEYDEEMMDYCDNFHQLINSDEKKLFNEWEEKVGYDLRLNELTLKFMNEETYDKIYHNGLTKIDGYVYVIKNSVRLLNSIIYLQINHISELNLELVYNYILGYVDKDNVVEYDFYDEWKGNTNLPDVLMKKYNIPENGYDYENRSFCGRNDVRVYGSDDSEYILINHVTASLDDWGGSCAVLKNNCDLKPFEYSSFARSISMIENNKLVKLQKMLK